MEFNAIGSQEWAEAPDTDDLENEESYTIITGNYKCLVCIINEGESYYMWMTPDKRIQPIYIKYVKKIVDSVAKRGLPIYTISQTGEKQDKMHRFLGGKQIGWHGDKAVWCRSGGYNG